MTTALEHQTGVWRKQPIPETRWEYSDCTKHLGRSQGRREYIKRQLSHWWHRLLYSYWRLQIKPGHVLCARTWKWVKTPDELPVITRRILK